MKKKKRGRQYITYNDGGLVAESCPIFVTPWTAACQAPPSIVFSRKEYWSKLPFPSPEDLPDPGIESESLAFQADTLPSETSETSENTENIISERGD